MARERGERAPRSRLRRARIASLSRFAFTGPPLCPTSLRCDSLPGDHTQLAMPAIEPGAPGDSRRRDGPVRLGTARSAREHVRLMLRQMPRSMRQWMSHPVEAGASAPRSGAARPRRAGSRRLRATGRPERTPSRKRTTAATAWALRTEGRTSKACWVYGSSA